MSNHYTLTANDTYDFKFSETEISSLDVEELSSEKFHVLKDNRSFIAEIPDSNFYKSTYSVKINSNTYHIVISNELDKLIEKMGLAKGSTSIVNNILAPMPGLILSVNVKEGDSVKEGDYLMVLEAMKMENTLSASREAVVKSVLVKEGETVSKNQILIEME